MVSNNSGSSSLLGSSVGIILSTSSPLIFSLHQIRVWKCGGPFFCHSIVVIQMLSSPKVRPSLKKPEEFLLLFMEHSSNYIIAITSFLILKKFIGNFWPFWITGKCKEKIGLSKLSNLNHCILIPLVHISVSSHIVWRQNDLLSNALVVMIIMHGILEVNVIIYS